MNEQDQNRVITMMQHKLVDSGVLELQMLAVDAGTLIEAVEDYARQAQAKYGDPYGPRTLDAIAEWIVDDFAFALGQSDAGM